MDDELEELLERAVALEVLRERGRVVGCLDGAQREVHRAAAGRHRHLAPQIRLEPPLQLPAQREQRRLPLPALVHPGQAAVVQLVTEVERELQILLAVGRGWHGQVGGRERQRFEQEFADRPARLGKRDHGDFPTR